MTQVDKAFIIKIGGGYFRREQAAPHHSQEAITNPPTTTLSPDFMAQLTAIATAVGSGSAYSGCAFCEAHDQHEAEGKQVQVETRCERRCIKKRYPQQPYA
jgi:hypothetical protein